MSVRLLLLSGWYFPDSVGGTEAYVHSLARCLQALGYELRVAAPLIGEMEREYVHDGLPVFRYPVCQEPDKSEVRGECPPRYFDVFRNWLDRTRPDVVHMHSFTRGCGYFHAQYAKSVGLPLVLTIHTPGVTCARGTMMRWGRTQCDGALRDYRCTACLLESKGLSRALAWPTAIVPTSVTAWADKLASSAGSALRMPHFIRQRHARVRELLDMANRVVVVSTWLHDVLRRNGVQASKLVLSRHGLPEKSAADSKATKGERPGAPLRVGYVGRFNPVKGVDVLVAAVRRLPRSVPVQLQLYGRANGEEEREFAAFVRRLAGHDTRIVFGGEVTEENREDVSRAFDILAVPSVWLEAGPLVVLEAFSAGIPVIGSDTGGIAELVTHGVNGLLVRPGDVAAWARALQDACDRAASGRWAWSFPRVRTTAEVASQMAALYDQLLGETRPRAARRAAAPGRRP